MNTATRPMYKWQDLPWKKIERVVFKLQKRIYQASQGVPVTKANLLRSGVLRKAHAPFWSSAREGDLPGNCNWVKVPSFGCAQDKLCLKFSQQASSEPCG
jgi:hypothetical protein